MYRSRKLVSRRIVTIVCLAAVVALAVVALPVSQAAAMAPWGMVYGTVRNPSSAPVPGIKVQLYRWVSGAIYVPDMATVTDAVGDYAFAVPADTSYRVLFTDQHPNPNQVWADDTYSGGFGFIEGGTTFDIAAGIWYQRDANLIRASRISVYVKRTGQWATPLAGIKATVLEITKLASRDYTTDSNGSVLRGGVSTDHYRVTLSDPSGKFGTVVFPTATTDHFVLDNDEWPINAEMPLIATSADISVSKPKSNSSVKHGKKLSVSGTLSKSVKSPKTMRLDAYQWSLGALAWVLNRQATLKIAKSGSKSAYSGSIKLPYVGSWRLVAVFPGSSKYAQSGSTFRNVAVN